jgi:excisionase family DNA binding protein
MKGDPLPEKEGIPLSNSVGRAFLTPSKDGGAFSRSNLFSCSGDNLSSFICKLLSEVDCLIIKKICQGKMGGSRMKRDYFTVNELAREFRVNPKTIYRRLWAKGIPAYKVGQQWRIAKKDLKWLKQ